MMLISIAALSLCCLLVTDAFDFSHVKMDTFRSSELSMKIFDWKKRETFERMIIPEDYIPRVTTLFPIPGSRKRFKRVGRGISAGQGGSCGRGMRGQNSRSGGGTRPGFEGGQTPLYRRIPKFVGKPQKNRKKRKYALIKIEMLNHFDCNSIVNPKLLLSRKLLTKQKLQHFKVVGGDELSVSGLVVQAHGFTSSARDAIESNNGTCIYLHALSHLPMNASYVSTTNPTKHERRIQRMNSSIT